jgi:hypothetical protein
MVKLVVLLAVLGCQGNRDGGTSGGSSSAPEPRSDASGGSFSAADADDVPVSAADAGTPIEEPEPVEQR